MHVPWRASSFYLEHRLGFIIISSFVIWLFRSFYCLPHSLMLLHRPLFFCNLWILNIVWLPPSIFVIEYVHVVSLISWEMHTLWRISHYIDLIMLFTHFGNLCQWGRSFRGFKGIWLCALSLVLKHLPFMHA